MADTPLKNSEGPFFDFEKPVQELEKKIEELKNFSSIENLEFSEELKSLEKKLEKVKKEIYTKLNSWQRVQLARHPKRPYTLDFIHNLMTDFIELHGDRNFRDDPAIVAGFARFRQHSVCVIGHQKGRDTKENIHRNFGSPHPEGFRKALRIMKLAEKFNKPIICFIDTQGAYPGVGAEERGQGEAIARNLEEMARLKVPIIVLVIGEGASGGALGIGVGDRLLMLENAWYGVISPEGCAAILWNDRGKAEQMAGAMHLSAFDLKELGLVDQIIHEPLGGGHRNPGAVFKFVEKAIIDHLEPLLKISPEELVDQRLARYTAMGEFVEVIEGDLKNSKLKEKES